VPGRKPPAVAVDARIVDRTMRELPALVDEVSGRLRSVAGEPSAMSVSLPFTEGWENGLADWTVTGQRGEIDCSVAAAGGCSLALRPAGVVSVSRRIRSALPAHTTIVFSLLSQPGAGRTDLAVDLLLGPAAVTLEVVSEDATMRVWLRSSGTADTAEFVLPSGWQRVWLGLDPKKNRVSAGVAQYGAGKELPLPPGVKTLDSLGFTARQVTGGTGTIWLDGLDINDKAECMDGQDNDDDGLVDGDDSGCTDAMDSAESPNSECDDGIDNDNDGRTDYKEDPSCAGYPRSASESPPCSNRLDDDGDGLADYPDDPECSTESDLDEAPRCRNGLDDDRDGTIDEDDLGCTSADDDTEFACHQVRMDSRGVSVVDDTGAQQRPLYTGLCQDPIERLTELLLVQQAATRDIRGYVDEYEFTIPLHRPQVVQCVVLVDAAVTSDPCALAGGRWLRRVAMLVRTDPDSVDIASTTRTGICTATLFFVVRNEQYVDLPNQYRSTLTLCPGA
jgi:hypothetical protein